MAVKKLSWPVFLKIAVDGDFSVGFFGCRLFLAVVLGFARFDFEVTSQKRILKEIDPR